MKLINISLGVLIAGAVSTFAYAEHTAPVYDVDSMSNEMVQQGNSLKTANPAPLASSSVEQRIARLEQQLENSRQTDSVNRIATVQSEVQSLRSQVEQLTHQLQAVSGREQTLRAELADKQSSKKLEEQAMNSSSGSGNEEIANKAKSSHLKAAADNKLDVPVAGTKNSVKKLPLADKKSVTVEQPNGAEEQAVYQAAYNFIKAKKYDDAIAALQKMLIKYPSGQFAANAHYWLGELYSLTGENEQASSEFNALIKHYPTNPRVSDAELKLGLIYATQLKWAEAKASFKKVVTKYPGTTSAHLAAEQLKQLKQASR